MDIKDLILDNLKISQRKFCKEIGISRQTIYKIINGRGTPTILTIKRICEYFDVDWKDYV